MPKWQFSLRTILVLTTFCAVGLVYYQHRQNVIRVIEGIEAKGGKVTYHRQRIPVLRHTGKLFRHVYSIDYKRQLITNEDLADLQLIPYLEALHLTGTPINENGLQHLAGCKRRRRLSLWGCPNLNDECVDSLTQMRSLQTLDIHNTQLTATGISRIARIPSLRHLIFSCQYVPRNWPEANYWYGHNDIIAITSRPDLTSDLVGPAYLTGINDQSLERFASLDLARCKRLEIKNSQISNMGIRALREHRFLSLDFNGCPLTASDIRPLTDVDLAKATIRIDGGRLSSRDIIDLFGPQIQIANIHSEHSSFFKKTFYGVVIDDSENLVEPDCFDKMPNLKYLNLHEISVPTYKCFLVALQHCQPALQTMFLLPDDVPSIPFWETIEKTPSLTELEVRNPPALNRDGQPLFTEDHQLQCLRITGGRPDLPPKFSLDAHFFKEVGKLKRLKELRIDNVHAFGAEIEPLTLLPELEKVRVYYLNDDAAELLLKMDLKEIYTFSKHLSPEMQAKMAKAQFTVLVDGVDVTKRVELEK